MAIFENPEAQRFENPALIKETREKLGLSQEELATAVGVTRSIIANIEVGRKRRLTKSLLIAIWDALSAAEENRVSSRGVDTKLGQALRDDSRIPYRIISTSWSPEADKDKMRERVMEKLVEAQAALIETQKHLLDIHKNMSAGQQKKVLELEERVALLSDLLNVETTKSLAQAEVEQIREKLSREEK